MYVTWINNISCPYFLPVDPSLHWANPNNLPKPANFPVASWPSTPAEVDLIRPPRYPWYEDAQQDVPISVHFHGAEVTTSSDGDPLHWYTAAGQHGPQYSPVVSPPSANSTVSYYGNGDDPSTLWYHGA